MKRLKLGLTFCGVLVVLTSAFLFSASPQTPKTLNVKNVDPQLCKTCHSEKVEYKEWETSAHAKSLEGLKKSDHAQDTCLKCMSGDWIPAPEDEKPTLETAKNSITCATCHIHDSGLEHNLLVSAEETCVQCHTMGEADVGDSPHHPQAEMFAGVGGAGVPEMASGHAKVIKDKCAECHMYKEEKEVVAEEGGHTWVATLAACDSCHANAESTKNEAQAEISNMLDAISLRLDSVTDKESEAYKEAKFNHDMVSADGSLGVHNYPYAKALLNRSISLLGGVPTTVSPDGKLETTWGQVKSE